MGSYPTFIIAEPCPELTCRGSHILRVALFAMLLELQSKLKLVLNSLLVM